jgi:YYY domain-containing protein
MTFGRESVALAVLLVAAISAVALVARRREIVAAVRQRWRIFLIGEAVFIAAFLAFALMRMVNPDLWHSHLGGEKPMDMAYLNAVLRSSYMPPYDPWFGDGYLNYYYMGQFMVATLINATGIDPAVAFNLAVALFFALTVAGAFSIVYNLAEGTRLSRLSSAATAGHLAGRFSPVMAGLGGAFFVAVIGNLDGAIQVLQGAWRVVFQNAAFGSFDFWRSSRMMGPDPPGHEITEFPFFTFLFADLHAHLMGIPFTLLALGLAMSLVLAARGDGTVTSRLRLSMGEGARLAVMATAIGALRVINAWDFPTYLLIGGGAVFLAAYLRNGGPSLTVLFETGAKSVAVFAIGYLVFLPYHLNYETFFASLESTTNQTVLWQFLAIAGLFVFIIGSYAIAELGSMWRPRLEVARRWVSDRVAVETGRTDTPSLPATERRRISVMRALAFGVAVLLIGFIASVVLADWTGSTVPFVIVLELMLFAIAVRYLGSTRPDAPHLTFALLMAGMALAIVVGLDAYRVEGDIDRMNSVFKFYIQVWVLLALASAYLLWRLADRFGASLRGAGLGKKLWVTGLVVLVLGGSVYTVLGTRARNDVRFQDGPLTLDGMAYMAETVYRDERGEIELSADMEGIRWLRDNVDGSPVVLEASTPSQYRYRWNGRISVYTGLPTIAGWQWHQEQQRWDYQWAIRERIQDIDRIYNTTDPAEALSLLRKYGVGYIYIGELERLSYPGGGLKKFDSELSGDLRRFDVNEDVSIYQVLDSIGAAESAGLSRQ